ncbi:MAG: hypothetical protein AAF517_22455 [Planctomycetota bacterium]
MNTGGIPRRRQDDRVLASRVKRAALGHLVRVPQRRPRVEALLSIELTRRPAWAATPAIGADNADRK